MKGEASIHLRLQNSLREALEKWILKECESVDWPVFIIPDRAAELMADSAMTVLEMARVSQEYVVKEGYLQEAEL